MASIFRTASIWLKVAMVAMALGLILFIIGFSTVSWIGWNSDYKVGLWKQYGCNRAGDCAFRDFSDSQLNDYHRAIQAMECLGLIGYGVATIVLFLYMLLDSCRRRDFLKGALVACFAGLAFAIVGFALFGAKDNKDNIGRGGRVAWSMGVACTGSAFYGLAGIMLIIQLIK